MADATLRFLGDPAFRVETRRKAYEYARPHVLAERRPAVSGVLPAGRVRGQETAGSSLRRECWPPRLSAQTRELVYREAC